MLVTDANRRVVIRFAYENELRHGISVYYHPSGRKWKEIADRFGELDGTCQEWDAGGELLETANYIDGRRIGAFVDTYSDGTVKCRAQYLFAKEVIETTEDWWAGVSTSTVRTEGDDLKHGPSTTWYKNLQKAMAGGYREGVPSGKFVWYHPNGQKVIDGEYVEGKQTGRWQWYFPSGAKHIQGEYAEGQQSNTWTWWTEEGDLADAANFNLAASVAKTSAGEDSAQLEAVASEPMLERLPSTPAVEAARAAGFGPTYLAEDQASRSPVVEPAKTVSGKGPVRVVRRRR